MELSKRVKEAAKARKRANEPIWSLIKETKDNNNLSPDQRRKLLETLYDSLTIQDLQEKHIYDAHKFGVGVSYRGGIVDLQRTKRLMIRLGTTIFQGANPKLKDRAFAESLGVPVPKTYQQGVPLSELHLIPHTIVEPLSGAASKGVFYVDRDLKLQSVFSSESYSSVAEAKEEIERFKKSISTNKWIVEQAILSESGAPANDFKVFVFYGKIGMYLEVDRANYTRARYAFYDADGNTLDYGPKYKNSTFPGTGVPARIVEYAITLSQAAPVPFLRLDFHDGEDGLFLGEITPHPGGTYANEQYDSVDRMLGKYMADAKARLYIDMFNGKEYTEFRESYGPFAPL